MTTLSKFISLISLPALFTGLHSGAVQATEARFPQTVTEHVGREPSDIIHCLHGTVDRQFCKVGWGPAFQTVRRLYGAAPENYAADLLIPDSRQTPFGNLTADIVLSRLSGSLWSKYRIFPELLFLLVWSQHSDCWQNGVLGIQANVISGNHTLGQIHPAQAGDLAGGSPSFALTNPLGERIWRTVRPDDSDQARAEWTKPNSVAVHAEFDFAQETGTPYPFSLQILPAVCRIQISNVQVILNRASTEAALRLMESEVRRLTESLMSQTLAFATAVQGADAVRCVLALQLESLKTSEHLRDDDLVEKLSNEAQQSLRQAMLLTSGLTGIALTQDPLQELQSNQEAWRANCAGTVLLNDMEAANVSGIGAGPAAKGIGEKYAAIKNELGELLKDAWSLSILLEAVNFDNRQLQWLIDSTVKYHLRVDQ